MRHCSHQDLYRICSRATSSVQFFGSVIMHKSIFSHVRQRGCVQSCGWCCACCAMSSASVTELKEIMTLQLARLTITVVYQMLTWVLNKEANPSLNSQPFAQIPINMSIDRSALQSRQGVWPENIELSAGVRGSSARSLTAQMRKCASFVVEIVLDIETTRPIIFQTAKLA